MRRVSVSVLILSILHISYNHAQSDRNKLQISRVIDESYSQIHSGVQEQAGQNLTLSCDLFSADNTAYDEQIAWGKATQSFKFKNESDLETLAKKKSSQMFAYFNNALPATQEVNRAVKTFAPLREEDAGTYFCGSMKYMIFEIVYVVVKPKLAIKSEAGSNWYAGRKRTNLYCNELMFKCKSGGACISPHYVCDKKPDCSDGSDESLETCKGDPCVDKLQCDNGRCIPTAWCCDRHLDLNCSVSYPPPCCQILSDGYEEPESYVPYNMTQPVRQNGSRYIFITLCILATFFSMLLLLLILSKIFMMAKKARCREARIEQLYLDDCNHRIQCRSHASIVRNYNYRARIVCQVDTTEVNDALLVLSDDILRRGSEQNANTNTARDRERDECPPSYTDVMSLEPPPPYTSQDCLNRN
ncbi:uncharacterized protein [Atheta coriaria]|uniref:uncharacterized protein n=1 Tax=Dalotia coriaria TaxID=877792 RepID=UPI0031F43E2E